MLRWNSIIWGHRTVFDYFSVSFRENRIVVVFSLVELARRKIASFVYWAFITAWGWACYTRGIRWSLHLWQVYLFRGNTLIFVPALIFIVMFTIFKFTLNSCLAKMFMGISYYFERVIWAVLEIREILVCARMIWGIFHKASIVILITISRWTSYWWKKPLRLIRLSAVDNSRIL